jgi:ribose transport system substrate-binding protein
MLRRTLVGTTCWLLGASALLAAAGVQADDKVVIGLSQPNLGWPYIAAFTQAFEAEAANHPNVEVVVLSAEGDIAKQANDFDTLIAKEVDVVLVCSARRQRDRALDHGRA